MIIFPSITSDMGKRIELTVCRVAALEIKIFINGKISSTIEWILNLELLLLYRDNCGLKESREAAIRYRHGGEDESRDQSGCEA
jgi:hypothetical protein